MSDAKDYVGSADVAAIDTQHALMKRAFDEKDANSIANGFYTPDAWVVGPDEGIWKGTEQIFALYKDFVGAYRWETTRERLIPTGDGGVLEYLIGTIEPTSGGEKTPYKILFAWVKAGNKWKCATQFFAPGANFVR
jgi:ketosteroid isomerase-like protein